ncbi:hypothetical protein, partial [Aeromonas caviae]
MAIWLIGMQLYFLQAFFLLPRKRVAARFGMQLYYSLTIAEADCRLVVMHSAQRDGIATRTGHL